MPTGRPVERALDFARIFGRHRGCWKPGDVSSPEVRRQVEEIDLKLPPKPKSQLVAEAAAKKLEKKKDKDMVRSTQSCKKNCFAGYVDFNSLKGHKKIPLAQDFEERGQRSA